MKYVIALFLFILVVECNAAEKIAGQIIYGKGPMDVTFDIPLRPSGKPDIEELQQRVRYYDAKGKKQWLLPGTAKEFRFTFEGEEFRLLSRRFGRDPSNNLMFAHLIKEGRVNLFEYQFTKHQTSDPVTKRATPTHSVEEFLLQKGTGELMQFTFKKDLVEFFNDCPALVATIEKDFEDDDVPGMVEYYNSKCEGN